MPIRLITIVLIICTSCQSGIIPCPKVKTAKLHKSFKPPASSLTARAGQPSEAEARKMKEVKPNDGHFIQNVSVEEWDCPKPGKKRYMPKSVKENIRKNKKKIESDYKENATDSLSNK
jgi:hypothetical protein